MMAESDPQKTFNVHDAKTQFSKLIDRAHAGEEIIVAKAGVPYAKLVPIEPVAKRKRQPGRWKGLSLSHDAIMAPCFTNAEIEEFENASVFPPDV